MEKIAIQPEVYKPLMEKINEIYESYLRTGDEKLSTMEMYAAVTMYAKVLEGVLEDNAQFKIDHVEHLEFAKDEQ